MKVWNFLIAVIGIALITCAEKTEKSSRTEMPNEKPHVIMYADPVDSVFASHFALLDSVLVNKFRGASHRIQKTMLFMDTTTGISAKGDGTPFGWFYDEITSEQYNKWKKWYAENKTRLKWDRNTNTIFRMEKQ